MSGNKKEEALIHVQGLGKSFGAVDVLKDISVDINKGDVVPAPERVLSFGA